MTKPTIIDFPVNRSHFWFLYLVSLVIIALLTAQLYYGMSAAPETPSEDIYIFPVTPVIDFIPYGEILTMATALGISLLTSYMSARKLLFAKFAIRLTDEGFYLHHMIRTRFYPWSRFSKVSIEPGGSDRLDGKEIRSELGSIVTFHQKTDKAAVTYNLLQADTTLDVFIEALRQFIPIEISEDVQDLLDQGR